MQALLLLISLYTQPDWLQPADTAPPHNRNYQVKLQTLNAQTARGYLVAIDDSTISLAGVPLPKRDALASRIPRSTYAYPNIASLYLKRKGALEKGVIWGTATGFAVGALAGFISGDDPLAKETGNPIGDIGVAINNAFAMTAGEKALLYGFTFAMAGSIIGMVVGVLSKKSFMIKGKKEPFDAMRNAIRNHTPNNPPTN